MPEDTPLALPAAATQVPLRLPPPPPGAKATISPGGFLKLSAGLGAGALIGWLGVYVGSHWLPQVPGSPWLKLIPLAAAPLLWLLAVAVHETGHLLGGKLAGGRFMLLMVGPLTWRRTPSGIRFVPNRSVNLFGGMAICLPTDPSQVSPRRFAVMIAGGPVASMVLGGACVALVAAFAAWLPPGTASGLAQFLAALTALISLLLFVVTALPATLGGLKTDGLRFLGLMRSGPRAEQEKAMLALGTLGFTGVRPADYDPDLVRQATSLRDGSLFDLYGHLMAFPVAIDRGDDARAQEFLDHVLAGEAALAPMVRDTVRCEYAWLLATRHGALGASAARAWLDSAGPLDFDLATRLRAEAAVLLAEGRKPEARERARAGLQALERRSLSPIKSPYYAELLEELERQAE